MSEIRVTDIKGEDGSAAVNFSKGINASGVATASNFKTGVSNLHDVGLTLSGGQIDVGSNIKLGNAGVVTATTFTGSGANLTNIPAANLTGTLPAIDGSNLTNVGGGLQSVQVFTSNGTWNRPSGITKVRITCTGGGAGGGGGTNSWNNGGGGGAGGTSIKLLDVTSIASVSVTVGNGGNGGAAGNNRGFGGGTSSFGSHCTGTGGEGGGYGWQDAGTYGNGGTATGGDINLDGGDAGSNGGGDIQDESASGAVGGASYWGGGGQNGASLSNVNQANYDGKVARAYGSGGGGSDDNQGTSYTGGAGKAGVVYVEEYA